VQVGSQSAKASVDGSFDSDFIDVRPSPPALTAANSQLTHS
jgi:hypothetical protein